MGVEQSKFAEKLRNGEPLIGTMVSLPSAEVTEILAETGFDWLFIDAEHGPFDPHDAQGMLQAAGECPCIIRVPAGDEVWIKKALDIGAAGIIVPQVNSAEHAERLVRMCKYPPEGVRGVGLARAHRYGINFEGYLENANRETAVILQAEHKDAAANIESIVKVPGIDAILIGPYDLSASLGKIGQITDPEVKGMIDHIMRVCHAADVKLGIFGVTPDAVLPYYREGFTLITVGVDSLFIVKSATEALNEVRGG